MAAAEEPTRPADRRHGAARPSESHLQSARGESRRVGWDMRQAKD